MHNIFVRVVDPGGAPLDGLVIHGVWTNLDRLSGSKGPGRAEFDLYLAGEQVLVTHDAGGRSYTSETTRVLDTREANIPVEDLIAGGYCSDPADCQDKIRRNRLCNGHYSYEVVFQRTW